MKKDLLQFLIEQLEKDHKASVEAAKATYDAATNEESKPENEYDTRGLEASYLAGAQAKRVAEIEELIYICKHIELLDFTEDTPIAPTALVEVDLNGKKSFVFLIPKAGGQLLKFQGKSILVITPSSPLGEALIGLKVGDGAVVDSGNQSREYEILGVI